MNVKYAANSLNVTAAGDSKKYKVAPDQKGVDVDLSDVHRTFGDSELPPRGTSHFMFGIEKDSVDGGYREQLTDFAAGFTKQCLQRGMNYSSFCAAVKQASAIDGVGEELVCLTKCSSAVAADFEKAGFASVASRLPGWASKIPGLFKGKVPLGAAKAAPVSVPKAMLGGAALGGAYGVRNAFSSDPSSRENWKSDVLKYTLGGAALGGTGTALGRTRLGKPVVNAGKSFYHSPIGHGLRGTATGAFAGSAADRIADATGWENHPNFTAIGATVGGVSRFAGPSVQRMAGSAAAKASPYTAPIYRGIESAAKGTRHAFTFPGVTPANVSAKLGPVGKALEYANFPSIVANGPITGVGQYPVAGNLVRGLAGGAFAAEQGKRFLDYKTNQMFNLEAGSYAPAIEAMRALNDPNQDATKPIEKLLNTLSTDKRQQVVAAAGALGSGNIPPELQELVKAMQDPNAKIDLAHVQALLSRFSPKQQQQAMAAFVPPAQQKLFNALQQPASAGGDTAAALAEYVGTLPPEQQKELENIAMEVVAQRLNYPNYKDMSNSGWYKFLQAYNAPDGGLIPAVRAYWGSLTPEQQKVYLLSGAALLGGGGLAAAGYGGLGAAAAGLGGLGLAYGSGAFTDVPGSAKSLYSSAPEDYKQQLSDYMQTPEFLDQTPLEQAELLKALIDKMQNDGKSELEKARGITADTTPQ